jgi:uncharacterized hydantoinase/oxoprolinase family protein
MLSLSEIEAIAQHIALEQARQISEAMAQVLSRVKLGGPVMAVGAGAFLAEAAARRLGLEIIQPPLLASGEASLAAPAVAVARLLQEQTHV